MAQTPPNHLQVPAYMAFFLVHGAQFGVGVLGFSRYIAEIAGYQSWLAVIIAGAANQLIIWMIFKTIKRTQQPDLYMVNKTLFGKWLGSMMTILFSLYFATLAVVVLRTYIEIVQVWIYIELATWSIALAFLLVAYYAIIKGFRVIAGLTFLFSFLPLLLTPTIAPVLEYAEWYHLYPMMTTSFIDILKASFILTLSFAGAELIFVYYPFLQDKEKAQQYAHLGSLATTIAYLVITFLTFIYYSAEQLKLTIWPTLSAWKIASFVFIERVEYIGIAIWLLVIFPNIILTIWASSRLLKLQFRITHRKTVFFLLLLVFIATIQFTTRDAINMLNESINYIGPVFIFGFIPFLLVVSFIRKKKGGESA
ncbi:MULTISPECIES: GerAB/ArcD/ProY family transporter [Shouchella]|uniref:Spore germination protein n=3 Tax=Bacillaceae TaxID=186817 RepID=A0A060M2I8_9BACI|nr:MULTISPECIES: GerAB/ArcD/ProY family transporter [Bacillaceae]RQW18852.1 spore gernimation protein GerB [Bacillus sp. C1-1]AIC96245.1 Spore germination protein [Shouchella lehensis G1]KQL58809.1 spore gernimation protein GerB [Alkalicoccobacillus plakortidis]MBG9785137.1 spore gernimation protein GerB [Shouchella lehensis]TES46571.1 spore gernimation protein GerB [Shouchella lehensis]